ncbi:Rhodanese-like domain-containing protein [Cynara cardunculus var. scolymus]|uniref:Rhodanese-like domain-containing protein n=1 Tax=Cynara cardunculus var. scolymus TaxID=59895 RepID=A0A103Y691_CYNCS|nr:Rhodanese-like domain-containing protein [Cynara cardunculus var. scolymus]
MEIQVNHVHSFSLKQPPFSAYPHHRTATTVKVHAVSGNPVKLIQSGTVIAIHPKDAAAAINDDQGYKLLDIRPEWEREKSRVTGSMHVPLFIQDMDNGPLTLLKKWVHFGYIGLWTGQYFTMMNPNFIDQVEKMVPDKTTKILVACGEGCGEEYE